MNSILKDCRRKIEDWRLKTEDWRLCDAKGVKGKGLRNLHIIIDGSQYKNDIVNIQMSLFWAVEKWMLWMFWMLWMLWL